LQAVPRHPKGISRQSLQKSLSFSLLFAGIVASRFYGVKGQDEQDLFGRALLASKNPPLTLIKAVRTTRKAKNKTKTAATVPFVLLCFTRLLKLHFDWRF
jgi:hypothetical protein